MRAFARVPLGALALLGALMVHPAMAQEKPGPVAEFSAGSVGFADDGIVNEGFVGGNARFYLSPRIGVGPEVAYIMGSNHSHLMLTGNLTWDILAPIGGRPRAVTPFLVGGAGLYQTRESFFGEDYTSSEGAFTAGGGVRAAVADRATIGVEARVGWELHFRINGFVGVRLW